jgi:hypothetical protein
MRDSNLFPWCMQGDPITLQKLHDSGFVTDGGDPFPICPTDAPAVKTSNELVAAGGTEVTADAWARRGAVNAGFAVFAYLKAVLHDGLKTTRYDQCEQLNTP